MTTILPVCRLAVCRSQLRSPAAPGPPIYIATDKSTGIFDNVPDWGYLTFNLWFSTFGVLWYAKETSSSSRYIFCKTSWVEEEIIDMPSLRGLRRLSWSFPSIYLTVALITFLLSITRIMTRLLNLGRIINASINASMIAWSNSGLPGSALNKKLNGAVSWMNESQQHGSAQSVRVGIAIRTSETRKWKFPLLVPLGRGYQRYHFQGFWHTVWVFLVYKIYYRLLYWSDVWLCWQSLKELFPYSYCSKAFHHFYTLRLATFRRIFIFRSHFSTLLSGTLLTEGIEQNEKAIHPAATTIGVRTLPSCHIY